MNLICYSHYTGGGILCNILNKFPRDRERKVGARINNFEHFLFIGDNWTVYDDFDVNRFEYQRQKVLQRNFDPEWRKNKFFGTHCHPIKINLANFNHAISITTDSKLSQLYRWLRAYHLYFKPQWQSYYNQERQDLLRETAKSYHRPFYHCAKERLIEIEFADMVHKNSKFTNMCQQLVQEPDFYRFDEWLNLNNFMFEPDKEAVNAFWEAEYELSVQHRYVYV